MSMTIDQAYRRLCSKAQALREEGLHEAAHDYQRRANDLASLGRSAAALPAPQKRKRTTTHRQELFEARDSRQDPRPSRAPGS